MWPNPAAARCCIVPTSRLPASFLAGSRCYADRDVLCLPRANGVSGLRRSEGLTHLSFEEAAGWPAGARSWPEGLRVAEERAAEAAGPALEGSGGQPGGRA